MRQPVQFFVDQRGQTLQGGWISLTPGKEQLGNFLGRRCWHTTPLRDRFRHGHPAREERHCSRGQRRERTASAVPLRYMKSPGLSPCGTASTCHDGTPQWLKSLFDTRSSGTTSVVPLPHSIARLHSRGSRP